MTPLLVYSSRTGNTETFVDYITNKVDIWVANDLNVDINNYDKIIIGAYTWASGKIPLEIKKFLIDNQYNFKGKKVFIFGSGLSIYPKFCGAVDGIEKIVKDCGADVQWIFKFEQRFVISDYKDWELNELVRKLID